MERTEFREAVFARDGGRCVACGDPAVDAHHIMERRLWDDGGYHLNNGASVCAECHMEAERGTLTPEYLSQLCGIRTLMLPPYLERDAEYSYDKWGNVEDLEKGVWYPGPLFYDESVQKVLAWRIERGQFQTYVKYPRTPHLPWSPGATSDDVKLREHPFENDCEIVVTEKLDGENTTMYRDYIHARSMDGRSHPTRDWVKNFHGKIAHEIPQGMRIVGENMYAKHSILYDRLPSYFFVISIWERDRCLSWDDTVEYAALLGLETVPVLYRGTHHGPMMPVETMLSQYGAEAEGYVFRRADEFYLKDFQRSVAKCVRPNHVTSERHWRHGPIEPNRLATC